MGQEAEDTVPSTRLEFGLHLNNREPLLRPEYGLGELLELAELAEELGFDAVWVGDSLFALPRFEPISLLAAISQRTQRVKLGTGCLRTSTRNPLYLALEWATLDALSGGRTILGACKGNAGPGERREFAALGLDFSRRTRIFDETLHVLRSLWWDGHVTFHGEHFAYDEVSFNTGTEQVPLLPFASPPPIWVISNPRVLGGVPPDKMQRAIESACQRIVRYGDGWMTSTRSQHPEDIAEQLSVLRRTAAELGDDPDRFAVCYQVAFTIDDDEEQARAAFSDYIRRYYPNLPSNLGPDDFGTAGSPETVIRWIRRFAEAGVQHFACRFGSPDQPGQLRRFATEVIPALRAGVKPRTLGTGDVLPAGVDRLGRDVL